MENLKINRIKQTRVARWNLRTNYCDYWTRTKPNSKRISLANSPRKVSCYSRCWLLRVLPINSKCRKKSWCNSVLKLLKSKIGKAMQQWFRKPHNKWRSCSKKLLCMHASINSTPLSSFRLWCRGLSRTKHLRINLKPSKLILRDKWTVVRLVSKKARKKLKKFSWNSKRWRAGFT